MSTAHAPLSAPRRHLAFLDNLKILLIILVVLHHAGQPYGPGGWWPFEGGAERSPWLGLLFSVNNTFFMSLMFFLSGYLLPGTVDRKGVGRFLQDRLRRLGIPLLFFALLVIPLMAYFHYISFRNGSLSLTGFLTQIYFGPGEIPGDPGINLGHLWFVEHLLLYAFLYAGWRLLRSGSSQPRGLIPPAPGTGALLGLALLLVLINYPLRAVYPWRWEPVLGFIQVELVKLPTHMIAFALGILAYRRDWLLRLDRRMGVRWFRAALLLIAGSVIYGLLGIRLAPPIQLAVDVTWEALQGIALSVGLLVLFRERYSAGAALSRWLGANTYGVYLFHVPVVVALQYALAPLSLPPMLAFALVSLAGVPLSFLVSHLVRQIPGVSRVV